LLSVNHRFDGILTVDPVIERNLLVRCKNRAPLAFDAGDARRCA
jgi:hypothetical protein